MKTCKHTEAVCVSDIHTAEWGDKNRGACKVRDNDRHDCAYVDARNALIPAAENITRRRLAEAGIANTPGAFARYFSEAMEQLVRQRGIVSQ